MTLKVFVIAGEVSGDFLAARLLEALTARRGPLELDGVGGAELERQGLQSRFPMDELSLVGLTEVVPHLPRLLRRIQETVAAARQMRPDLVLSVDSPSFGLRVQGRLQGIDALRVHYVAPQAWAWRPWRAKTLGRKIDQLLYVLPFEEAFFQRYGVAGVHVGHPLVERVPAWPAFVDRQRRTGPAVVCLLPGSRRKEIERHVPVLREVTRLLTAEHAGLSCVLPTLPKLKDDVLAATADWPAPLRVDDVPERRFEHYAGADLALASTGTVNLELALARLPMAVFYKTSWLTAQIIRRLALVPYASLANLVADRAIVPEFLQEGFRAPPVAAAASALLRDDGTWAAQVAGLDGVARALGGAGPAPSARAAAAVDALLEARAGAFQRARS